MCKRQMLPQGIAPTERASDLALPVLPVSTAARAYALRARARILCRAAGFDSRSRIFPGSTRYPQKQTKIPDFLCLRRLGGPMAISRIETCTKLPDVLQDCPSQNWVKSAINEINRPLHQAKSFPNGNTVVDFGMRIALSPEILRLCANVRSA